MGSKLNHWVLVGLLGLSQFSCSVFPIGKPLPQGVDISPLVLGKTNKEQILSIYGRPDTEQEFIKNDNNITMLSYFYAVKKKNDPQLSCPIKSRIFWFNNSILVGTKYSSTFQEEDIHYNFEKYKELKKGDPIERAYKILGEPNGKILPPISDTSYSLIYYLLSTDCSTSMKFNEIQIDVNSNGRIEVINSYSRNQSFYNP